MATQTATDTVQVAVTAPASGGGTQTASDTVQVTVTAGAGKGTQVASDTVTVAVAAVPVTYKWDGTRLVTVPLYMWDGSALQQVTNVGVAPVQPASGGYNLDGYNTSGYNQ